MAESTITKILLRRGPEEDLSLPNSPDGVNLDIGEPGWASDKQILYIGGESGNVPVPRVDSKSIVFNTDSNYGAIGELRLADEVTSQIKSSHTGNSCGEAAICATEGGIYAKKDINCGGDVVSFCSSDEQLKDNIKLIDNPLEKLNKIKGVTFEWNCLQSTYDGNDTGILAQDVEDTGLPGLVQTRDDGFKAVKYDRLVPLLIESIKQLNKKVDRLSSVINNGVQ